MREKELFEQLMRECLTLAHQAVGYVSPNPQVGAIVVKGGKIIAKGYHKKFGQPHAEIEAFRNARASVEGATLIVNLEPCSHFGKTPPCVDEIIKRNISHVVIGMKDPNPLVAGKGIAKLRKAGITVTVGVLNDECKRLNESFIKFITTKIPYVTLKAAQTLDGKIADTQNRSQWLTGVEARTLVHQLRGKYDSVLVGAETVLQDNPSLTVRMVKGRNPHRIILDGKFRTQLRHNVYKQTGAEQVFVFVTKQAFESSLTKVKAFEKKGINVIPLKGNKNHRYNIKDVLDAVGERNIASILVEGGAQVFSEFIEQKLADKLMLFIAPKILGKGIETFYGIENNSLISAVELKEPWFRQVGEDVLLAAYF